MNGDTINPWTIGVARQGNGPAVPHERPQHRLTVIRESTDTSLDHFISADDAAKARVRRLKEAGIKHRVTAHVGGQRITYADPVTGDQITLNYEEMEGA